MVSFLINNQEFKSHILENVKTPAKIKMFTCFVFTSFPNLHKINRLIIVFDKNMLIKSLNSIPGSTVRGIN